MKAKNLFLGLLPVAAALMLTACDNEDNAIVAEAPAITTIPFSVTVGQGNEMQTRVGVQGDNSTLFFTEGDKLIIESAERTDISGTLTLKAGDAGKSSGATFEGTISYQTDLGEPDATTALTGVVPGSYDNETHGNLTPTSIGDAVEIFSILVGESTWSARSFTLTQQTAFLNFNITLEGDNAPAANTELTFNVYNQENTQIGDGTVTTTEGNGKVVAKFVVPLYTPDISSLQNAIIVFVFENSDSDRYTGQVRVVGSTTKTLEGKVYNVTRTISNWSSFGPILPPLPNP